MARPKMIVTNLGHSVITTKIQSQEGGFDAQQKYVLYD